MFVYLVLLFTILPAVELALLIKIGSNIGLGNTLFIIIFTGVLGAYLARLQGFLVL
ncbi:MAG: FxsA family protein, partial [Candidatus Omnitrophica bacterium]|nr:FxsA family protein [Candidatus Omnitrophota bacterium]